MIRVASSVFVDFGILQSFYLNGTPFVCISDVTARPIEFTYLSA